jgi:hypothetical protein
MSRRRVSIVLTLEQYAALELYAKERLMKPSDIMRIALSNFIPKSNLRAFVWKVEDRGESSKKLLVSELSELLQGSIDSTDTDIKTKMRKSAFWPVMRAVVFERDGYKCQLCGGDGNGKLHIHHIVKRKLGGKDEESNLITLCPPCHKKADTENLYLVNFERAT